MILQIYHILYLENIGLGGLEVFLSPMQMKKNRPATLILVICPAEAAKRYAPLLLRQTAAIGFSPTFHEGGKDLWKRF